MAVEQDSPPPGSPDPGLFGCATIFVLAVALSCVGTLGLAWVLTLEQALFPVPFPVLIDVGRALGYALLLGLPFGLAALFLRQERFALWRGFALALALAGLHGGLAGGLLALDRALDFPGSPAAVTPLFSLLFGVALVVVMRRRLLAAPRVGPLLLGVGLGLMVSLAWAVIGVLGLPSEALLAVLEAVSSGLVAAVLLATVFTFEPDLPARRPFWSAMLVSFTLPVLLTGLLAVRGYWLNGIILAAATAALGLVAGGLLVLGDPPDLRRQWWALWAYLTLALLIPFAWTEGFEGDWMLDDMAPVWSRAILPSLGIALLLGFLALLLRRWLARRVEGLVFPAVFSFAGLALLAGAYLGLGQPGLQPRVFFVVMADQPDTTFARELEGRDARYAAVYETLTEHALESQADLRAFLDSRGVTYTPYYLVNGIEVEGSSGLRAQIAARDDVARVLESPQTRPLPPSSDRLDLSGTFSVDASSLGWGVDQMDAERVWDEFGVTGEGIIVGHADSGVDGSHPALSGQYAGAEGSHDYAWFDPWEATSQPTDTSGHGTHTLGIVLGQDGIGVAPGAQWISCRNLARNLGNPPFYLDCMQFLLAPFPLGGDPFTEGDPSRGAHVTNNSWGCPPQEGCDGLTLPIAVQHLRDAGQFFVVSAGNEGPACSTVGVPATADAAFGVGASNSDGDITNFSSRGPVLVDDSGRIKPDVAAPGDFILSSVPGGGYAENSGTSMAGPHVAGLVALLWSADPNLIGDVDATEALIQDSAHPHSAPDLCGATEGDQNNVYGYGIVDAFAAVEMALEAR